MSQYERMKKGLLYDPADEEISAEQRPFREDLDRFNALSPSDIAGKTEYMKRVFAECGENCFIEAPFYANWGGHNVHMGNGFYANFGLTLVDDGDIYFGDNVMIGPNVTIATANHPIDPELRKLGLQYNRPVHIGSDVWIGAGTVIVPGVTIGDGSVIGAGSVVTRDIPGMCVAFGDPCRVVRTIGDRDREYYYREEKIDRAELMKSLEEKK